MKDADTTSLVCNSGDIVKHYAAKAIIGKIEWLASNGSILRLDAVALGLSLDEEIQV